MLDEIVSNVVNHSGATVFELDAAISNGNDARLTVADDGRPYDPLAHADPDTTLPAADRPLGGLGILIVKKMADTLSYRREGDRNILTFVKTVKSGKKLAKRR
ncbi:MAG: ATP-binding protein [Kiritimatiellae bacterium]|nr:ATP-binding protein [Kiritimatiellia bacterium]